MKYFSLNEHEKQILPELADCFACDRAHSYEGIIIIWQHNEIPLFNIKINKRINDTHMTIFTIKSAQRVAAALTLRHRANDAVLYVVVQFM
jgi:hypothetical protein